MPRALSRPRGRRPYSWNRSDSGGPAAPDRTRAAGAGAKPRQGALRMGGGSLRAALWGRLPKGGAVQTSDSADALLKGSRRDGTVRRSGQRRACARATRLAQCSYWLPSGFRRAEAEVYVCALISGEWARGLIRSARVTRPLPLFGNGGWVPRPALRLPPVLRGLTAPALPPWPRRGAAAWPLGGNRSGRCRCLSVRGSGASGAVDAVRLGRAHSGAGRAPVPPARGSAVAATWGKEAERELGTAVAGPAGGGAGEGWPRWARATGESGVWVGSAANFPPPCRYGRAAAGRAGILGLTVPTLGSGKLERTSASTSLLGGASKT